DTVHLYEQVDVALELRIGFKIIGDLGPRELLKDLRAVRFQARVMAKPKRRRRRQSKYVRQEVSCRIHYLDTSLEIGNADVYVNTEDQQAARDHLQFVDQELVPVAVV